jgi:hypothetical protein
MALSVTNRNFSVPNGQYTARVATEWQPNDSGLRKTAENAESRLNLVLRIRPQW